MTFVISASLSVVAELMRNSTSPWKYLLLPERPNHVTVAATETADVAVVVHVTLSTAICSCDEPHRKTPMCHAPVLQGTAGASHDSDTESTPERHPDVENEQATAVQLKKFGLLYGAELPASANAAAALNPTSAVPFEAENRTFEPSEHWM
jgi:hypothetical protein